MYRVTLADIALSLHKATMQDSSEMCLSPAVSDMESFWSAACISFLPLITLTQPLASSSIHLVPVTKGTTAVVQQLLKQCQRIGLKCSLLLLNRGIKTLSYLKRIQQAFLMPLGFLRYTASGSATSPIQCPCNDPRNFKCKDWKNGFA